MIGLHIFVGHLVSVLAKRVVGAFSLVLLLRMAPPEIFLAQRFFKSRALFLIVIVGTLLRMELLGQQSLLLEVQQIALRLLLGLYARLASAITALQQLPTASVAPLA